MNNNDIGGSNTFTHNHNCLMGTTTFKVHHITLTSPKNTLATIFESILIFFFFFCFTYSLNIFLLSIKWHNMHGYIRKKGITQLSKPNILFLLCKCHTLPSMAFMNCTQMLYDWGVLVVRWLFMPFS